MALTATQLESMRDALQAAIYSGVRSVSYADRRTDYASVDEMRKALADLNNQIAAQSSTPIRTSYATFTK
jgi:hypothetical protein